MASENEVEIRFHVMEDKAVTTSASSKNTLQAEARPQEMNQRERDSARKIAKVEETSSKWDRFEARLEQRMRRIGARLIAANLVSEGADILGIGNSFVTRLGQHAIQGFMMGGAQGAALYSVTAIVHQIAEIIKGHSKDLKRIRQEQLQQAEAAKDLGFDFREQLRKAQDQMEEKTREILEQFREAVQQENINVQRYVTQPYLGAIGG